MTGQCRIGIDVGGTFTDFVLADRGTGELVFYKEPSVPDDPASAVTRGLAALLERAGRTADDIELVVHGTTIALNAVLQKRGGKVGLVISRGFGDTMELARGGLPNTFSYKHPKQPPLIPRDQVFEIDARLRPDGTVLARPDEVAVEEIAERIRAAGVEAVGVVILNSYAHPALERELSDNLQRRLPGILVTASAALWPEIREYERTLVTALNGFVQPLMERYFSHLSERLRAEGVAAPLFISTSNGGTVSIDTARERPVDTLLSGPASGVVAASRMAQELTLSHLVTLDMGGTSSDIAIIQHGHPEFATETRLGDLPIILPVVDVWAIGAGGGSIIWVDDQGVLKVGPESAGADPGPVCYGRGGTQPTVTDCYVALGLLDPDHFLGGRMRIDREAAVAALAALGRRIGLEGAELGADTAMAALRIATARMATEVSKGMAQRGLDPKAFTLMPFGGAGPTHAALLAGEGKLSRIVVPPSPGTFCAMGAVLADIRRDFAQSQRLTLGQDPEAGGAVAAVLEGLEAQARGWIEGEGSLVGEVTLSVTADMQYPRTAFVLTIAIPEDVWRSGDATALAELFHREHERLYAFRHQDNPVDITTLRLRVNGKAPPVALPRLAAGGAVATLGRRRVYDGDGRWVEAEVYDRRALPAEIDLAGPAIVEQEDSTIWVPEGWHLATDRLGCLHLTHTTAGAA